MRVEVTVRLLLLRERDQQPHEQRVLEDVGKIAGVKNVPVGEHYSLLYLVARPRDFSTGYFFALSASFFSAAAARSMSSLSHNRSRKSSTSAHSSATSSRVERGRFAA